MLVAPVVDWLSGCGNKDTRSVNRANVVPTPGDATLLAWAAAEGRILVTIDTDFGELLFVGNAAHRGLVRLPDVPVKERIALMKQVLERYSRELEAAAIITVRGRRIRISKPRET